MDFGLNLALSLADTMELCIQVSAYPYATLQVSAYRSNRDNCWVPY